MQYHPRLRNSLFDLPQLTWATISCLLTIYLTASNSFVTRKDSGVLGPSFAETDEDKETSTVYPPQKRQVMYYVGLTLLHSPYAAAESSPGCRKWYPGDQDDPLGVRHPWLSRWSNPVYEIGWSGALCCFGVIARYAPMLRLEMQVAEIRF